MATAPTFESLEEAALRLKPNARAKLAHTLVDSLSGLSRAELNALWLEEAERRDTEMESGRVTGIPGERVFAQIESKYKK
jgi:putative addiction module component (TIGR02574 family)